MFDASASQIPFATFQLLNSEVDFFHPLASLSLCDLKWFPNLLHFNYD